jgi:hypothetical protein
MSDLYTEGRAIVVVPEILCRYRKHEKALSANSLGMVLRMRHIKTNVKRRRQGLKDRTFIEFREQLSAEEFGKLEKDAKAADSLRAAYYSLRKGRVFDGVRYLCVCVKSNPPYLWDKVKHNLLRI